MDPACEAASAALAPAKTPALGGTRDWDGWRNAARDSQRFEVSTPRHGRKGRRTQARGVIAAPFLQTLKSLTAYCLVEIPGSASGHLYSFTV